MCLYKTEVKPRIAKEPVKVYKLLKIDGSSPMHGQVYHRGVNVPLYTLPDGDNQELPNSNIVTSGYLHAFQSLDAAKYYAHELATVKYNPIVTMVVEMYIPKGAEYWLGIFNEIAAEKLYWPEENTNQ